MKLQTIPEAARLLGMNAQRLRRAVQAGHYPSYAIGGREMVDVDALRPIVEVETASIGIREASALTGLSEGMLRKGIREGWLPHIRVGNGYRFVAAKLLETLEAKKRQR